MRKGYLTAAVLAVSILVAIGLHHRGFSGPFYVDSNHHLIERKFVYATNSVLHVVKTFPTRAVSMASLYAGYRLHGMDPYAFRLTNAVLLGCTGAAIFVLLTLLLEIPILNVDATPLEKMLVAMAGASLFVVHTLQILSVLYVIQRMALMSCFFYLCCLIAYFSTRMGRFKRPFLGYAACGALFLLALFSKENAITAPVIILVAEFTFFTRHTRLSRGVLAMCLVPVMLLAMMLVVVQVFFRMEGSSGMIHQIAGDYAWAGHALHEVIMTQCRVFFGYLTVIITPFASHIALIKPVVISTAIFDPPVTVCAVAGLVGVLVAGILVLRRRPLAGFGMLSLVLMATPEAIVDPKLLCLQYRAILLIVPVLFVVLDVSVMALAWGRKIERISSIRALLLIIWFTWTALTAVTTVRKAELWGEPVRLWADVVDGFPSEDSPHIEKFPSSISLNNLGTALHAQGYAEAALNAYRRALRIRPESAETHHNIGNVIQAQGRAEEAIPYFRKAIELKPQARQPYINLGAAFMSLGRFQEAKEQFEIAVKLYPQHPIARANLGMALLRLGNTTEAERHLKKAFELDPNAGLVRYQLGLVYHAMGRWNEAAQLFHKAIDMDPNLVDARYHLADIMFRTGRFEEAARHFKAVVEKNPHDVDARNNLGVAYMELSRLPEAIEQFRAAVKIRPDIEDARVNLDKALKAAEPK